VCLAHFQCCQNALSMLLNVTFHVVWREVGDVGVTGDGVGELKQVEITNSLLVSSSSLSGL